jgi:hypothetical protein
MPEPEAVKPLRKPADAPSDQAQPVGAVIVRLPLPAAAPTLAVAADTSIVQALAWLTVTVWPAIVAEPERAAPVFALSMSITVPDPVPLVALVEMNPPVALALQGQLVSLMVSAMLLVCAAPVALTVVGSTLALQPPAWLTLSVSVAPVPVAVAVSVAARAMPLLAATV